MNEFTNHSAIQNPVMLNLDAKLLFCLKVERHKIVNVI